MNTARHLRRVLPLGLALALLLCACGGGGEKAPFDPAATADALLESGAFSETLEAIDQDVACILYGIDESTVTGGAVYGSTGATAEEIAVFTLSDAAGAAAAKTALENRVTDQKAALESYLPAEIVKLDAALIEQRGNSVLMVVASDIEAAEQALTLMEG